MIGPMLGGLFAFDGTRRIIITRMWAIAAGGVFTCPIEITPVGRCTLSGRIYFSSLMRLVGCNQVQRGRLERTMARDGARSADRRTRSRCGVQSQERSDSSFLSSGFVWSGFSSMRFLFHL